MSHKLSIRLDDELYSALESKQGTISDNCRTALQQYINCCGDVPAMAYNHELVDLLKNENQYLKDRLDFFMMPWYLRIFKRENPQLPPRKPLG